MNACLTKTYNAGIINIIWKEDKQCNQKSHLILKNLINLVVTWLTQGKHGFKNIVFSPLQMSYVYEFYHPETIQIIETTLLGTGIGYRLQNPSVLESNIEN